MRPEFDKEIDSLLRDGARRERAASIEGRASARAASVQGALSGAHLDADELNAYAENALPAATRNAYAAHLVDCDVCRRSVTQLALAAGLPAQLEQREDATQQRVTTNVSWRERVAALFAPRAWRYGVPALALLLVSAVALILFVRSSQRETSVAQRSASEPQRPLMSQPETHHAPQNNATTATSNESAQTAPNSNGSLGREEIAARSVREGEEQASAGAITNDAVPPPPTPAPSAFAPAPPAAVADIPVPQPTPAPVEAATIAPAPEAKAKVTQPVPAQARVEERQAQAESRQRDDANMSARRIEPAPGGRAANANDSRDRTNKTDGSISATATRAPAKRTRPRSADSEEDEVRRSDNSVQKNEARAQTSGETRTVAGRKFRRQGDAWVDTAYNSTQAVTIVRRNSEQYRALVADEPALRRIADALGGEVTVVWKGRAYRFR